MKGSPYELVSTDRKELVQDITTKCESYMLTHPGQVPVKHRQEIEDMVALPPAAVVRRIEQTLGHTGQTVLVEFDTALVEREGAEASGLTVTTTAEPSERATFLEHIAPVLQKSSKEAFRG